MEWLLVPVGVALILAGVTDVFFTVLHYDGFGFLSSRLNNRLFGVVRFATRPLPRGYRDLGLSLAAPAMIPVTIVVWILLISLGYAMIYYAGMSEQTFIFASGLKPSFGSAVYVSGVSISTLGFGDITPVGFLYQALTVSEALIGFGILTISITYVLGILSGLTQLDGSSDTDEAYVRYKEWLAFAYRNRAFFEASAKDLGYNLKELNHDPGERLF